MAVRSEMTPPDSRTHCRRDPHGTLLRNVAGKSYNRMTLGKGSFQHGTHYDVALRTRASAEAPQMSSLSDRPNR